MIKTRLSHEMVLVTFELPAAASATSVSVCGEFNDWSPAVHPLTRNEDGSFRASIELAAGRRWQYRFLLDGQRWENDWAADDYVANVHGGEDSVVDLTDISGLPSAPNASPPDAHVDQAEPDTPPKTPRPRATAAAPAKPSKEAAGPATTTKPAPAKPTKKEAAGPATTTKPAPAKPTKKTPPDSASPATAAGPPVRPGKRAAPQPASEASGTATPSRRRKPKSGK